MLFRHRGPLPVLGVALAVFCVSEGVAAAQTTPREIALKYAYDNAESLGVKQTDMTNLAITTEYQSAHNQVTHVNIGQRRNGLQVFTGHVTVNVNRESKVVFAGGNLVRGINDPVAGAELSADQAIAAAADGLKLDDPAGLKVVRAAAGRSQATLFSGGGISAEPIPAQLGYQPTDDGLRVAWQVTIHDEDGNLYEVTVDAITGDAARPERLDLAREDAEPGQRRVQLPHLRVPEAGPERRPAHAGDQPGGRVRLAVRLA